jgi:hypothetical protein
VWSSTIPNGFTNLFLDAKKTEGEKADEADAEILAAIARRRKLASDLELAKGIQYTESIESSYVHNYPLTLALAFISNHFSDGVRQNISVSGPKNTIATYGRNITYLLMVRISRLP